MKSEKTAERIRSFWRACSVRERRLLSLAGVVLGLAALYAGIVAPLAERHAALERQLPQLRAQHRLALVQVAEIERLRQQDGEATHRALPLVRQVETRAMARGLAPALLSISALGEDRVQVIGKARPAGEWLHWLFDLRAHGVQVESLMLHVEERSDRAGLRATLRRGGTP